MLFCKRETTEIGDSSSVTLPIHFANPRKSCRARTLKQRFIMRAMALCSKLRLHSCLLTARARRKAKNQRGQQQHVSFTRRVFSRHHICIHRACSRFSNVADTRCAYGCRKCARETRQPKMGQAVVTRIRRATVWT